VQHPSDHPRRRVRYALKALQVDRLFVHTTAQLGTRCAECSFGTRTSARRERRQRLPLAAQRRRRRNSRGRGRAGRARRAGLRSSRLIRRRRRRRRATGVRARLTDARSALAGRARLKDSPRQPADAHVTEDLHDEDGLHRSARCGLCAAPGEGHASSPWAGILAGPHLPY